MRTPRAPFGGSFDDPDGLSYDARGERLRRALNQEAAMVTPSGDGLDRIRDRTRRPGGVPWMPFLVASAVAIVAGVVAGVTVFGPDNGRVRVEPAPPAATGSTPPAASVTPSPSPTSPPPTQTPAATASPTGTTAAGPTANVPVYYVGQTTGGLKLYREFRRTPVPGGAVVRAALTAMAAPAADRDYRTLWSGTRVVGISRSGDLLDVEMSAVPPAARQPIGVQQLVYTVTAADPKVKRVRISGAGAPASFRKPFTRAPQINVVAPVWVLVPVDGATVGRTVTISGDASVFEATVSIEVVQGARVVKETFATAARGAPGRGAWSTKVTLPAGSYVVRAFESSAEDGRPLFVDTKAFTVR